MLRSRQRAFDSFYTSVTAFPLNLTFSPREKGVPQEFFCLGLLAEGEGGH